MFVKTTLNITAMNSKRKDLQYASVFLLAVALTFLMGKGDNLWLVGKKQKEHDGALVSLF